MAIGQQVAKVKKPRVAEAVVESMNLHQKRPDHARHTELRARTSNARCARQRKSKTAFPSRKSHEPMNKGESSVPEKPHNSRECSCIPLRRMLDRLSAIFG